MDKFELQKTSSGDRLTVDRCGPDLLRFPLYNKGTGFTPDERRALGSSASMPKARRSSGVNPSPLLYSG